MGVEQGRGYLLEDVEEDFEPETPALKETTEIDSFHEVHENKWDAIGRDTIGSGPDYIRMIEIDCGPGFLDETHAVLAFSAQIGAHQLDSQ